MPFAGFLFLLHFGDVAKNDQARKRIVNNFRSVGQVASYLVGDCLPAVMADYLGAWGVAGHID